MKDGASISDTVRGRTLGGLNVDLAVRPSRTIEFLRLLADEDFIQLNVVAKNPCWSALFNTLCCESDVVDGLRLFSGCGVKISRITDDGSTALHVAARMCPNPDALDYLCKCWMCSLRQSPRPPWVNAFPLCRHWTKFCRRKPAIRKIGRFVAQRGQPLTNSASKRHSGIC